MVNGKLREIIDNSSKIVFFGGAGVSRASGIPDFRSADGLYSQQWKYPPETIISHDFFYRNTEEFYRFYKQKMLFPDALPNAAHKALASLERAGKLLAVVTQNIDGLHQKAGSKNVFELHGSVHRNTCTKCGSRFGLDFIVENAGVPRCPKCAGLIKPDVVLYGESLDEDVIEGAVSAISEADTMIVGGTSLVVYPAAGLLRYFRGKNTVVINRSPTSYDDRADLVITDPIAEVFSESLGEFIE